MGEKSRRQLFHRSKFFEGGKGGREGVGSGGGSGGEGEGSGGDGAIFEASNIVSRSRSSQNFTIFKGNFSTNNHFFDLALRKK